MKIVNRGFIKVQGREAYMDWANKIDDEFICDEDGEANLYLIEEDFFEIEPVIKANFKKIFINELLMITDDESVYPAITMDNFLTWFSLEMGSSVFDSQSDTIESD